MLFLDKTFKSCSKLISQYLDVLSMTFAWQLNATLRKGHVWRNMYDKAHYTSHHYYCCENMIKMSQVLWKLINTYLPFEEICHLHCIASKAFYGWCNSNHYNKQNKKMLSTATGKWMQRDPLHLISILDLDWIEIVVFVKWIDNCLGLV